MIGEVTVPRNRSIESRREFRMPAAKTQDKIALRIIAYIKIWMIEINKTIINDSSYFVPSLFDLSYAAIMACIIVPLNSRCSSTNRADAVVPPGEVTASFS